VNLTRLAVDHLGNKGSIGVALIGAGKFGSMFLAQIPTSPGIRVAVIADLDPGRAMAVCEHVGWERDRTSATRFTDDAVAAIASDDVDIVVEATGDAIAGVRHALAAIGNGKHIVMVNVEADVLAGPALAARARRAGVVYSLAYGDQPALIAEMCDWARASGFGIACAGKGTKYLPDYHALTPDEVWTHYGLTPERAIAAGMNPRMFNSFMDGTKSAIEMAAVANAANLAVPEDGLQFPPLGLDDIAQTLRPVDVGGTLPRRGMVEVVSSLKRDGTPVEKDLRWGVYVVLEAQNLYASECFGLYGMKTDSLGQFAAMHRPYHLIGLELNISIISAVTRKEATGAPINFRGDVVTVAKRDLKAGEVLDGEGGYTVWGKAWPARRSLAEKALPIGFARGTAVKRNIKCGEIVGWADVDVAKDQVLALRRESEKLLG
jgi:predicted homoserine dehydrogenase-like protein